MKVLPHKIKEKNNSYFNDLQGLRTAFGKK